MVGVFGAQNLEVALVECQDASNALPFRYSSNRRIHEIYAGIRIFQENLSRALKIFGQ